MADLSTFEHYYKLADTLICPVYQRAACRMREIACLESSPSSSAAWKILLDQTLTILAEEPNDVPLKLLTDGMENLVGVLGNVISGLGEEKH